MTPRQQQLAAFLRAIREEPEDDTQRLILADWLEEHGGEPARAEYIRLQVARASLPEWDPRRSTPTPREAQLLEEHRAEWLGPLLNRPNMHAELQRGMLHLSLWPEYDHSGGLPVLASEADEEALAWVDTLHLSDHLGGVHRLIHCQQLALVSSLVLRARGMWQEWEPRALASSPHLARLTRLELSATGIRAEGVRVLAESSQLARLSHLGLGENGLADAGAEDLAALPQLARLSSLDLRDNGLGLAGVQALGRSPHLVNLSMLNLSGNRQIGPDAAGAVPLSPHLANLTALGLAGCWIGREGVRALVGLARLARLSSLNLDTCWIGDEGVRAIADSTYLPSLTALNLANNGITPAGVRALADSPNLGKLSALGLWSNDVGTEGAFALARTPHLGSLSSLVLWSDAETPISEEAKQALRDRFGEGVSV